MCLAHTKSKYYCTLLFAADVNEKHDYIFNFIVIWIRDLTINCHTQFVTKQGYWHIKWTIYNDGIVIKGAIDRVYQDLITLMGLLCWILPQYFQHTYTLL